MVIETLANQQTRYERYFDKKVKSFPVFIVSQTVYIDLSPLSRLRGGWQPSVRRNKLLVRKTGPFRIPEVQIYPRALTKIE